MVHYLLPAGIFVLRIASRIAYCVLRGLYFVTRIVYCVVSGSFLIPGASDVYYIDYTVHIIPQFGHFFN